MVVSILGRDVAWHPPCQYLCNPPNFIIVKSLLYKISNCVAILDNMIRRLLVMRLRAQAIWAVSFGAIRVPDWVILHIYTTAFKCLEPSYSSIKRVFTAIHIHDSTTLSKTPSCAKNFTALWNTSMELWEVTMANTEQQWNWKFWYCNRVLYYVQAKGNKEINVLPLFTHKFQNFLIAPRTLLWDVTALLHN